MTLAVLGLSNCALALERQYSPACRALAHYALGAGLLCLAALPVLHWCVRPERASATGGGSSASSGGEDSASGSAAHKSSGGSIGIPSGACLRFLWRLLQLLLYCGFSSIVLVSLAAISWLARDTCSDDRALRQMVLADVMVVLSAALSWLLSVLLRCYFPDLRFSHLTKQAGKALLLMLCIGGLVCDATNLVSHGPRTGRMTYHWGFSPRPLACLVECPWPPGFEPGRTARSLQCFDANGAAVGPASCAAVARPPPDHPALQPCPMPLCACAPPLLLPPLCDLNYSAAGHWAVLYDSQYAISAPLNAMSAKHRCTLQSHRARRAAGVASRWGVERFCCFFFFFFFLFRLLPTDFLSRSF